MKHYPLTVPALILVLAALSGCPLVRATGDTVQAAGEGTGHVVRGTGQAIGEAAHEITNP